MLACTCDARCDARNTARLIFQQKITHMHTPDILTHLICNSMDSWLARRPVITPVPWNGPEEPIKRQIRSGFRAQARKIRPTQLVGNHNFNNLYLLE
jgi:hypothetical protein